MVELGFLSGEVADHIAEAGTSRQLSKRHGKNCDQRFIFRSCRPAWC